MQLGASLHGFVVQRAQPLQELDATLYELSYTKNGARLVWLDRADENMTFAIGFKTPPTDDTGVFHIIEHSVLCGSEKYPVKDPFVVLLKSSLQTFLNALTFSDKTVYPVSSRNKQDFLNLMDVYLDAVLHPLSAKDPHAFLQEGWHYELSDDGILTRNGVVYNEMKGSFANPDTVLSRALERALFPDNCYSFVSGGDPAHIPELTYEGYLAQYRRCYHPSNSYIFLDGTIDIDAVLSKLDSFLAPFAAVEPCTEIPMQAPITPPQAVDTYEISSEEADLERVLVSDGYVYGTYQDIEAQLACEVLIDVLTGTNDAPLKKALLEPGLCEDVELDNASDTQQPYMSITLRNTTEEKAALGRQAVRQVLQQIAAEGFDHAQLYAAIDHLEFIQREKDSGRTPLGLIFGISALDQWLYGGDCAGKLELGPHFAALRRGVEKGLFETLLKRVFLENKHHASVMLLPDAALGETRQAEEKTQLAALCASWTAAQRDAVQAVFTKLRATQEAPDSPEQLAKLPKLSLKDIPEQLQYTGPEQAEIDGYRVIFTPKNTGGISYLTLHFALNDLTLAQRSCAEFLCSLFGEIATDRYTPTQLFTEIQANLGHLSCHLSTYAPNGRNRCDSYFEVSLAVLEDKKEAALQLVREMLCHSHFDDQKAIFNFLRQEVLDTEQGMIASGSTFAIQHALSGLSVGSAVVDATDGIAMLRWLQQTKVRFETDADEVCAELAALCKTIFIRERLTFSATGALDVTWLRQAISTFPSGTIGEAAVLTAASIVPTGYQIPAQIGFAAKAADLEQAGGCAKVASKLLSLDYLWNEVRVKGGAYGVGFGVRLNGLSLFYTYRDPNPCGALASFARAGAALRCFCGTDESLDDYIISSISDLQPLLSPHAEGRRNTANVLDGITPQTLQKQYSEVLHTTKDDLRRFSLLLDEKTVSGPVCVIGGENVLDACKELLPRRELVQGTPTAV